MFIWKQMNIYFAQFNIVLRSQDTGALVLSSNLKPIFQFNHQASSAMKSIKIVLSEKPHHLDYSKSLSETMQL